MLDSTDTTKDDLMVCDGKHTMYRDPESVETIVLHPKYGANTHFTNGVLLVIQIVWNPIDIFAISSWCI